MVSRTIEDGAMEKKNTRFLLIVLVLLVSLLLAVLRSRLQVTLDIVWFMMGAFAGTLFVPAVDKLLPPQSIPATRSILFILGFCAVSFFVVTSATGTLAQGLVIALGLSLLLVQIEEYSKVGNLASWYRLLAHVPSGRTQLTILWGYGIFMGVLTILLLLRGIT